MLFLYSDPALAGADGAAILAFAFSLPITTMVVRGLLALCYLPDLSRPGSGDFAPAESSDASASRTTGANTSATTRV